MNYIRRGAGKQRSAKCAKSLAAPIRFSRITKHIPKFRKPLAGFDKSMYITNLTI